MDQRILALVITQETDIIVARRRTRKIAELLGFDNQDQTRITTAVSEIVRNALEYGKGGRVEYRVRSDSLDRQARFPFFEIVVTDNGGGIANLKAILDGLHKSTTGMGVGITGARRLMERFDIETSSNGTKVTLAKPLPRNAKLVTAGLLAKIGEVLARPDTDDLMAEIRRQNQDTLFQLEELQKRQEELQLLNQELQDTNRGVVALYAELDERADHLRRADQLKSRFLSNMSHEFRTPLNSILSLSRLLLTQIDGRLTSEQEKQVTFIRTAAEDLTTLVNDLLDLARVEAGKTVVTPKEFTVADLFGALRGMLRPLLVGDAVNLAFEDPRDIPPLVTDEGKVSQILRNFISNALKFTDRGEVRVWAEYDRLAGTVTFKVRDTGVGIAPEHIETVWKEFEQVPNRLQAGVKGTGLGLPLARNLAVLLGGGVAVESALGEGSVFSVTIPQRYAEFSHGADVTWQLDPERLPVLVVEDNAADAFSIERILADSRYQVMAARTLAETKRAMEQFLPAAVLLDVMLQGEESWRALIEMRQNDKTHHIPVIVISTVNEERKARHFGANEYFDKPVRREDLLRALDDLTPSRVPTKVLLVDDEEISRYLIRQLLPTGDFNVIEAHSVQEGLARAESERPDLMLVDLNMPQVDGYEMLNRLKASEKLRNIPVIIVTSMVVDEATRARLNAATDIVSKFDLTSDVLVQAVRASIEKNRRAA